MQRCVDEDLLQGMSLAGLWKSGALVEVGEEELERTGKGKERKRKRREKGKGNGGEEGRKEGRKGGREV